jgi:CRP-like cAMP-binding protein
LSGAIALDEKSDGSPPAHIVRPDSLVGEVALLVETERRATAMAREPTTVLKISRELFHRVLREYPDSAKRLKAAMADDLRAFVRELEKSSVGQPQ